MRNRGSQLICNGSSIASLSTYPASAWNLNFAGARRVSFLFRPLVEVGSNQSGGIRLKLSKVVVCWQPFRQPLVCWRFGSGITHLHLIAFGATV
jgi:hypothetical protein